MTKESETKKMADYKQILEQYINSSDFKQGVISSTKASWGGSGYSVELFEDGTWRNLWNNQIGNRYETPGIILGLPTISEDGTRDLDEEEVGNDDSDTQLGEAFDAEADELRQEFRDEFHDHLIMAEANNG